MTKYFKLLGVALIAMSMALVSCEPTDENPTDDQQQDQTDPGTNPPDDPGTGGGGGTTPDAPAGSIAVNFGGESWEAVTAVGAFYPTQGVVLAVALSDAQGQAYPRADVCVNAAATGTYTDEMDVASGQYTGGVISYVEYYKETYLTDGTYKYGDWWAKSLNMNVTAFDATAMTMSATVNAVMFDAVASMVQGGVGIDEAATETMIFVANGLQMVDGEQAKVSFLRR